MPPGEELHDPVHCRTWDNDLGMWIEDEIYERRNRVSAYSLTVNREKLLELLAKRRDEIDSFYNEKISELNTRLEKAKDPNKAWAEYYAEMGKRVKDGTLLRDETRPRGEKWVALPGTPAQPSLPQLEDVDSLVREVAGLEERRTNNQRPYDTAISMLEIAVGDEVEIPVSEYENLLKRPNTLY